MSSTSDPGMLNAPDVAYNFNRSVCLGWTLFSLALVAGGIVIALTVPDQRFAAGLVPGWLFGSFCAALFSGAGLSWARRLAHSGPALVLSHWGITADKRLGGITNPSINGLISWDEVASVSPGAYGSVVLRLRDPEAFWARKGLLARILAWHPSFWRGDRVTFASRALAAGQAELVASIQARSDRASLGSIRDQRVLPDATARDEA